MGLPVSAREMIDAARGVAGQETLDESNAFVTNIEALGVLNGELAEIWDLICENHDDPYFAGSSPIDLEAGVTVYPLGVDIYKVTSVDVEWSPGIVRSAKRFNEAERNRFKQVQPSWSQYGNVYWRLRGSNIEFIPEPQTGVSVTVNYIPSFTPLTTYTDTFESHNLWHWAAIWGLAAYMRLKDDDETSAALHLAEKAKVLGRVRAHASQRNEGEAPRVQQVRYRDEDDF
jgi:hypothetical protein